MLKLDEDDCGSTRLSSLLKRIATALDCTAEDFSEPASSAQAQTAELLRLWFMIEQEHDRSKVLSVIRTIASEADAAS